MLGRLSSLLEGRRPEGLREVRCVLQRSRACSEKVARENSLALSALLETGGRPTIDAPPPHAAQLEDMVYLKREIHSRRLKLICLAPQLP